MYILNNVNLKKKLIYYLHISNNCRIFVLQLRNKNSLIHLNNKAMKNSSNTSIIRKKVFTGIFYSIQSDDYIVLHFNSLIELDRFEKLNRQNFNLDEIYEESINLPDSINIY